MESVLNFVSLVSLAITAIMAVTAFILVRFIGKKCTKTDQQVLFWLIWDAMIHFCVEGPFIYLSLTATVQESDHWIAEICK
ncbi:hypothetical protein LSH36_861g00022 [Paralvinella palmiformis]|uniref:Uncharacterized protein n=1 Tax=Paralvinella palmiformis TaxID=53620 RepID=A0AAD9MTG4_9ANNE|nr:hypothetical protein LSH36_861g00022 [Paralvinella palmiformis]